MRIYRLFIYNRLIVISTFIMFIKTVSFLLSVISQLILFNCNSMLPLLSILGGLVEFLQLIVLDLFVFDVLQFTPIILWWTTITCVIPMWSLRIVPLSIVIAWASVLWIIARYILIILIFCSVVRIIAWSIILISGVSIVWIVSIRNVRKIYISIAWRSSRSIIWITSFSRIWMGSGIER